MEAVKKKKKDDFEIDSYDFYNVLAKFSFVNNSLLSAAANDDVDLIANDPESIRGLRFILGDIEDYFKSVYKALYGDESPV